MHVRVDIEEKANENKHATYEANRGDLVHDERVSAACGRRRLIATFKIFKHLKREHKRRN